MRLKTRLNHEWKNQMEKKVGKSKFKYLHRREETKIFM